MPKAKKPNVQSVSDLTRLIKYNLNRDFRSVWVSGEISGMTRPSSGHVYLTLKDKYSQISGVIWQSNAQRLKFEPENGLEVICGGNIDVYPQRGTYQLNITALQPKGIGSLELARKQLEAKLRAEGVFAPELKKPIPRFPNHVAVVTSPTGAAIRDFLQVLTRRWPRIRVTIVPVKVQGHGAGHEVATGVSLCNHFVDRPDVIVVTRGGGSAEDLWSFNEEIVVRSIFASEIPVVSGVGHEIDVTLSDLVADVRALTPSEAAERLTPHFSEVVQYLQSTSDRMKNAIVGKLQNAYQQLETLASRPVITQPLERIRQSAMEVDFLENRMSGAINQNISQSKQQLQELTARLNAINPLAVLARGYSLTSNTSGELIRNVNKVEQGDRLTTKIVDGTLFSTVDRVEIDKPDSSDKISRDHSNEK